MANSKQCRNLIFNLSFGAAAAAVAIAFVLVTVASKPAQAQTFKVIHNFTGGQDGASPYAGVTLRGGNLYGTAFGGGIGDGTVYQLKHKGSGWTFNPLFAFDGSDGAHPEARVIFGPNGTLYGTTSVGGQGGDAQGTVFNLKPPARACTTALCLWTETVLYTFQAGSSVGGVPEYGDLLFDQAGNIYGTTYYGGNTTYNNGYGAGLVYQLTPSGPPWTENVLYAFSITDGEFPSSGVIFDNASNIYGTTSAGGLFGYGTVFELMYPGWTQQCTLNNFNGSTGAYPYAGLIPDPAGNLYGATTDYGQNGGGTVFKLTPLDTCSWTLETLYSFTGSAGRRCGPWGTLVMDGSGNLYGTTYCDGTNNAGNVFELIYPNWTYKDLYDFTGGNDGGNPTSNVVIDPTSGNLYGTASAGGTQTVGVVWEITFP